MASVTVGCVSVIQAGMAPTAAVPTIRRAVWPAVVRNVTARVRVNATSVRVILALHSLEIRVKTARYGNVLFIKKLFEVSKNYNSCFRICDEKLVRKKNTHNGMNETF